MLELMRSDRPTGGNVGILPIRPPLKSIKHTPNGTTLKGFMTRDYNNQRRDNVRPFSRNSSSGRPGDERAPRPARPRPNRASVDRAWESGAPTHHADYRTRNSYGNYGQPPRNNWHNNQPSEHSSAQYGRKPYGDRQDSNRRFERTPYGNTGPRSRSFDSDRRN